MCDDLGLNGMLDVPMVVQTERGGCDGPCGKGKACSGEIALCPNVRPDPSSGVSTSKEGGGSADENGGVSLSLVCTKCKRGEAVSSVRQRNDMVCAECLFEAVRSKFRYALKTRGVISPGDRVLVPTTGDSSTQALLDLLLLHRNPDVSRPLRGKVNFELQVVWVDSSCLYERENLAEEADPSEKVRCGAGSVMEMHGCSDVDFVRIRLEEIVPGDDDYDVGPWLKQVVDGIKDQTGREDFIKHLNRRVIVKHANSNSFNKIALADSATSIAIHMIGASSKARGFDLPGDIHYQDARLGAGNPVEIRPLRDIFSKELEEYCHFRGIPVSAVLECISEGLDKNSINDLATNFVLGLQSAFPSGLSSILRTGSKLQAFEFNRDRGVGQRQELSVEQRTLCKLCCAPLPPEMGDLGKEVENLDSWWKERFCFCCLTQIVLKYRGNEAKNGSDLGKLQSFFESIGMAL